MVSNGSVGRALVVGGFVLAALLAAPKARAQSPEDPFLAQHRAGLASNTPTHRVFLRHPAGKRVFQAREPIELEMVIEPAFGVNVTPYWTPCPGWQMVEVVFDRTVSNTWSSLCPEYNTGLSAGVVGGIMGGGPRWTMPLRLNGPFRFDAPGRYRLFVRAGQLNVTGPKPYTRHETSDVFEIEILPRDDAWEAEVARRAAVVLADPASTQAQRTAARESLRVLGTRPATELLSRHADSSDRLALAQWFLTADDLPFALASLEAELRRPERVVDGGFVRGVAQLARAARRPAGPYPWDEYLELIRHYAIERVGALQTVPTALAAALRAEFDTAASERPYPLGALWPALSVVPHDVEAVFRLLEAPAKARLLERQWAAFDHPAFLPLVRRTYEGPAHAPLRDIALRRFYELSSDQARPAILLRLAQDDPGVSVGTLGLLPDATLPALERRWVELLEQSFDEHVLTSAAERLARYGSAASASRAADAWLARHDDWSLAVDPPLIAFLVRVAPARAQEVLRAAMADAASAGREGFDAPLIGAVAAWHWGPPLEAAAIAALMHENDAIVAGAAQALSAHGGTAARSALEQALRRTRQAAVDDPDGAAGRLEGTLASALANARRWHLSERTLSSWRATCGSDSCEHAFRARRTGRLVDVYCSGPFDVPQPLTFGVGDVTLPSVDALTEKMRQYPRDTGFYVRTMMRHSEAWPDRERRAFLDDLRARVAADGLSVWMDGIAEP
jgi:hypothetical protein